MAASNRWNLSRDYYDVLPADSEMDAPDDYRCEDCDGLTEKYYEDALYESELCSCDDG
mgnify:FL=1